MKSFVVKPFTECFLCRQTGQATTDELRSRDLRRELEEKERDSRERKDREKTRSFTGKICGVCVCGGSISCIQSTLV